MKKIFYGLFGMLLVGLFMTSSAQAWLTDSNDMLWNGEHRFQQKVETKRDMDIGDASNDSLTISASIDGTVFLNDNSGAAPNLIFQDGTDEKITITKVDASHLTITTSDGTTSVQILTGNLRVGNSTGEDVSMDGEDTYLEGTLEVDGNTRLDGDTDIGDDSSDSLTISASVDATLFMNDDSGATPAIIFQDGTDERVTILKVDTSHLTVTTPDASTALQILTGNFRVGDGTPDTASMDGEDAYVDGELEVDGAVRLDGAIDANSTMSISGTFTATGNADIGDDSSDTLTIASSIDGDVYINDNSGASPNLIFQDATDERVLIAKVDTSHLTITLPDGTTSLQVLTGNLRVGNGTGEDVSMDAEDAYIEGTLEVDGTVRFDGVVTVTKEGNISFPLIGTFVDTNSNTGLISESTDPTLAINDGKAKLVWTDAAELTKRQVTFHVPDDYASGGVYELMCTRSGALDPPSVDFEQLIEIAGSAIASSPDPETAVELDPAYYTSPQQVTLTPALQTYAAGMRVTFNYWRDDTDTSTDSLEVSNAIWTYTKGL